VHKVKENSAAFNIGLRANDIITNVNGIEIKGLSIPKMSKVIAALKAGENYSLGIERGNRKLDLLGQLQPLEIPAYQVVIDTKSIGKAKSILASMTYQAPVRRVDRVHSGEIIGFYFDPWAPNLSSLSNRGADLSGVEALNSGGARASSTSSSSNSSSVNSSSSSAKPSGASNPNN
uniref:PDZ domain-containing protein n=1 Tax=Candidatus Enterovibrio escicola TaxID=1927127 RepID=UPI0012382077